MDEPTPESRIAEEAGRIERIAHVVGGIQPTGASPASLTKIAARLETARITLTSVADELLALAPATPEN